MAFYILHSSVLPLDLDIALWSALINSDVVSSTVLLQTRLGHQSCLEPSPVHGLLHDTMH